MLDDLPRVTQRTQDLMDKETAWNPQEASRPESQRKGGIRCSPDEGSLPGRDQGHKVGRMEEEEKPL